MDDEIFVLIDNTMTGNAKNGAIITETSLYHKMRMLSPDSILLKDIKKIQPHKTLLAIEGVNSKFVLIMDDCPKEESTFIIGKMLIDLSTCLNKP